MVEFAGVSSHGVFLSRQEKWQKLDTCDIKGIASRKGTFQLTLDPRIDQWQTNMIWQIWAIFNQVTFITRSPVCQPGNAKGHIHSDSYLGYAFDSFSLAVMGLLAICMSMSFQPRALVSSLWSLIWNKRDITRAWQNGLRAAHFGDTPMLVPKKNRQKPPIG